MLRTQLVPHKDRGTVIHTYIQTSELNKLTKLNEKAIGTIKECCAKVSLSLSHSPHITSPNQTMRTWVEICRTRTQSASAIRHRAHPHIHPHSYTHTHTITHRDDRLVINLVLTDERKAMILFSLPHHDCNKHTYIHRGGGMEVAILRVRESVVCEGDFGLAGVVIGYTYQWLFLPLPYIRLKLSLLAPSFPPTRLPLLPLVQPLNVITFPT